MIVSENQTKNREEKSSLTVDQVKTEIKQTPVQLNGEITVSQRKLDYIYQVIENHPLVENRNKPKYKMAIRSRMLNYNTEKERLSTHIREALRYTGIPKQAIWDIIDKICYPNRTPSYKQKPSILERIKTAYKKVKGEIVIPDNKEPKDPRENLINEVLKTLTNGKVGYDTSKGHKEGDR